MNFNEKKSVDGQTAELEKDKVHIIVEIIEYVPNAVLSRTIIKKNSGNVTIMSIDKGEEIAEKAVTFDTFIQVIDGCARLHLNGTVKMIPRGGGIIIPANMPHYFTAEEKFKMVSTVIKSGYENESVAIL